MSDSRVEKLADYWKDPHCEARHFIREFERAGLIVLDRDDLEVEKRIVRVLDPHYEDLSAFDQRGLSETARAVLSALTGPPVS